MQNARTKYLIIPPVAIAVLTTIACTMQKTNLVKPIEQGIEGHIYLVTGNQMPMKGKPVQRHGKGIVREVWIYKATTMQQAEGQTPLFTKISTSLAAKVKSDSTGHYQAALPAGLYSVFVKERNQFFASETEGEGILNPAEVVAGKVTSRNVTVNIGAAY